MQSTDRYIILSTSSNQPAVIKATNALEDAGIPVMVQHLFQQPSDDSQYQLMVPDRYSTRASTVIAPHLTVHG